MAVFAYRALDSTGAPASGLVEAKTKGEAYKRLLVDKLQPLELVATDAAATKESDSKMGAAKLDRLSSKRLLQFTEELADLLDAGLQLEPALRVIETREERSAIKSTAAFLRQQVREGKSFSGAMRECRGSFSELYINMIAAGEAAGALNNILRRQAQYTSVVIELQRKVSMALIYPSIVLSAGILLMGIFMTVLLPQLTTLLAKTGRQLPLATQLLIESSEFLMHYWWVLGLCVAVAVLLHRAWISTPKGRRSWDEVKLKLPLVGPVLRQRFFAQFLQTLSTLVSNGVTLINALALARNATENTSCKAVIDKLGNQVGEGVALSRAMKKSGFFPPVLIDIVGVGEQTGKIGLALQRGADRYDKEFSLQVQRVTLMVQPAVILVVALFVGLVAYSMISGILTTVSGLRAG